MNISDVVDAEQSLKEYKLNADPGIREVLSKFEELRKEAIKNCHRVVVMTIEDEGYKSWQRALDIRGILEKKNYTVRMEEYPKRFSTGAYLEIRF